MRDFILRIVSQWRGDGADQAKRATREVATEARQASREAEPGRFRRFFDGIRQGARRATDGLRGMLGAMRGIIGIGFVGTLAMMTRSLKNLADQTRRSADMTGLTNREWQALAFTGRELKVRAETLETALTGMNRRIVDNEEHFRTAGIQTRAANGEYRQTIDVLTDVADVISGMSSAQERAAVAQRLMGRSGQQMLPILNRGGEAMKRFMDEAERRGQILDDDTIDRLNEAADRIEALRVQTNIYFADAVNGLGLLRREMLTTTERMQESMREEARWAEGIASGIRDQEEGLRAIEGLRELAVARERDMAGQTLVTQIRLENQANLLRRQADHLEENLALIVRTNQEEAKAAEIKARQERLDESARIIAEAKAQLTQEEVSAQERLAQITSQIAELKKVAQSGDEGSVEAAVELSALLKEQASLSAEITAEKEAQAAADREEAAANQENLQALRDELQILQARAAGQDDLAERLEYERDLREATNQIMVTTGLSEERARAKAAQRLSLERQIADAKRSSRQETKEETKEQRRLRELMDQAVADPFGRGLEGREAIRELQRGGHLDRNQRVVQETLLAEQARRRREGADGGPFDGLRAGAEHRPAEPAPAGDSGAGDAARSGVREIQRSGAETSQAVERMGEATVTALRGVLEELGRVTNQLQTVSAQIKNQRN